MKLYGYSERGLVNALCYDCVHDQNGETLLAKMLQQACFPLLTDQPSFSTIQHATFLVEQSLSQFGDCDLIILCDTNERKKFAVFCEFKRGKGWSLKGEWKKFTSWIERRKGKNKITSNLFCQLHFKERFSSAIAEATPPYLADGLEFDEPLNIGRGNGRRKIGSKRTVLRAVDLIHPYVQDCYFLMVTPQQMDPKEMKSFVDQANNWQGNVRDWSTNRWGHLSLSVLHQCCQRNPEAFSHTLEIFDFNHGQLY